ncbi:MAG: hypothetical protein WC758_00330 [Candidatus Woesearchaeota archaeon]
MHLQKQILVLFLLVFILSASSEALVLSEISIVDARAQPIIYISPNAPILVNLVFNYTLDVGETFEEIYVSATDLFPDGIYSGVDYSKLSPLCEEEQRKFTCKVNALTLKMVTDTANIHIFGVSKTEENRAQIENITTITFTIDNSKPKVTFLGTDKCDGETCYISSGKVNTIKIIMEDERATFTKANIGFQVGQKRELVDGCEGLVCTGSTRINCQDNQIVKLKIRHDGIRSKDDSGNKVDGGVPRDLICDATPPEILAYNVTSITGANALTIENGLEFEINITDESSPIIKLIVDASSVLAGNVTASCIKSAIEEKLFRCSVTVVPGIENPGEYDFNIIVEDIVGWDTTKSMKLKLLKTSTESINLWKVLNVEQSSQTFSRQNMDFERTIFARVNLQSSSTVEILDINPEGKCYAVEINKTGFDTDVVSVKLIRAQDESVYLKISIRENNDGRYDKLQKLQFNCPIVTHSKKGNYFYSESELDNFSITINFRDEPALGDKLKLEIDSVASKVEKTQKVIKYMDTGVRVATTICNVCARADQSTIIMGTIQTAASTTATAVPALAAPAMATAEVASNYNLAMDEFTKGAPCAAFKEVCVYFTCDSKLKEAATSWMDNDATKSIANAAGYQKFSDSMNPYKSYPIAVATGCVPAVIHHYKTLEGINCNYLSCISQEYVTYGQDISICMEQKKMSTCVFFVGGAINAVPGASLIRDTASRLGQAVKDPIALFGLVNPWACKLIGITSKTPPTPVGKFLHGSCVVVNNAISATKIIGEIKKVMDVQGMISAMSDPSTGCGTIISAAQADPEEWTRVGNNVDAFKFNKGVPLSDGRNLVCTEDKCYIESKTEKNQDGTPKIDQTLVTTGTTADDKTVYIYNGNKKVESTSGIDEKVKKAETAAKTARDAAKAATANKEESEKAAVAAEQNLANLKYKQEVAIATIALENAKLIEMEQRYSSGGSLNGAIRKSIDELNAAEQNYANLLTTRSDILTNSQAYDAIRNMDFNKKLNDDSRAEIIKINNDFMQNANCQSGDTDCKNAMDFSRKLNQNLNSYYEADAEGGNAVIPEKSLKEIINELEKSGESNWKDIEKSLKAKVKADNKEIKDAAKEVNAAARKLRMDTRFEDYFGTWQSTALTSWGAASRIASLRELTNIDWGLFKDNTALFKIGDAIEHNVITEGEYELCKNAITTNKNTGEGVILNIVDGTSFTTGAQITARKSEPMEKEDGKKYYTYWVQGGVATNEPGLSVRIILYDEKNEAVDYTINMTVGQTVIEVTKDVQFNFGRPQPYQFESTIKYTKACIKFDVYDISSYFDVVSSDVKNSKMLCQTFVSE